MEQRSQTFTRRQALAGGAALLTAGIGGIQWGSGSLSAHQIDSTPPAPPEQTFMPPVDPIAALAAELNYDQDAIFAFVRDEIHYESYAGVLRGAKGTLWARAGNSADQAVLLGALLTAAQIPFRFATGQLDSTAQQSLSNSTQISLEDARLRFQDKLLSASGIDPRNLASLPDPEESLTPEMQSLINRAEQGAQVARSQAAEWTTEAQSIISTALTEAGIALPELAGATLAAKEITEHIWIEVPDGPTWQALDPAMPTDDAATTQVATGTSDSLPPEMHHVVRFRVVAEDAIGGMPVRRDVVTVELASDQLVGTPVLFTVPPTNSLAGMGLAINEGLSGELSYNPTIVVGETFTVGPTPIIFQADGDTALSALGDEPTDGTPADGETLGLWIVVEVLSPDAAPVIVERPWFDRIGADQRGEGTIDLTKVMPVETYQETTGTTGVRGLDRSTILSINVANIPASFLTADNDLNLLLSNLNTLGPAASSLRDVLAADLEWPQGFRTVFDRPGITGYTFVFDDPGDPASLVTVSSDLLVRGQTAVELTDAEGTVDSIHPLIQLGIVDYVAERQMLDPTTLTTPDDLDSPAYAVGPNVGLVFASAAAQGIPIMALETVDALDGLGLRSGDLALLRPAVENGAAIILPVRPVTIDGEERLGWWIVDLVSGATRDQMDDGGGSSSVSLPAGALMLAQGLADYALIVWNWIRSAAGIKCLLGVAGATVALRAAYVLTTGKARAYGQLGGAIAMTAAMAGCLL